MDGRVGESMVGGVNGREGRRSGEVSGSSCSASRFSVKRPRMNG